MLDCAFGTGGSMIKMEKIRANELFFNEQLESAEDYDYWVKSCSVLSFAATDEICITVVLIINKRAIKTKKDTFTNCSETSFAIQYKYSFLEYKFTIADDNLLHLY